MAQVIIMSWYMIRLKKLKVGYVYLPRINKIKKWEILFLIDFCGHNRDDSTNSNCSMHCVRENKQNVVPGKDVYSKEQWLKTRAGEGKNETMEIKNGSWLHRETRESRINPAGKEIQMLALNVKKIPNRRPV